MEVYMEALWLQQRAMIRHLLRQHPDWTLQQIADAVGCSTSMVKKWRDHFAHAASNDLSVLFSRPRLPRQPRRSRFSQRVRSRLLELREQPPDGLQRVPGPRTLLFFLHRDPELTDESLPRSSRTVWRILREEGVLVAAEPPQQQPWPPREPLEGVQIDAQGCGSFANGSR